MLVECELCEWVFERDETDDPVLEAAYIGEALNEFAKHMWLIHPDRARTDAIAVAYLRAIASEKARWN